MSKLDARGRDTFDAITAPVPILFPSVATRGTGTGTSAGTDRPVSERPSPAPHLPTVSEPRPAGDEKRPHVRTSTSTNTRTNARAWGGKRRGAGWQVVAIPMITLSVLALWAVLFALGLSAVQEHRSQHQLQALFREQLAAETVPVNGPIRRGAPVASLTVAAIGLHHVVVVEGTNSADLETGPGHRPDTVLPGQVGVSVLMGRSVLFGAPFGRILDLRPGALITVVTGQGTFRYRVTDVRGNGNQLPYPLPDGSGRLTLIASAPSSGTFSATRETVYVDGTLQGAAQPASTGRPSSIPNSEAPMKGDVGSLAVLVVWLALLVATLVVAAWARTNWGLRPTLLVTVPVLVAALWMITGLAAQLLPNLF